MLYSRTSECEGSINVLHTDIEVDARRDDASSLFTSQVGMQDAAAVKANVEGAGEKMRTKQIESSVLVTDEIVQVEAAVAPRAILCLASRSKIEAIKLDIAGGHYKRHQ